MIGQFKAPYPYEYNTINNWNSKVIGVYYCGALRSAKQFVSYYIGRAVGDDGIRGRLLQHRNENKWKDVTHFGYRECNSAREAIDFEEKEIARYKPKYNRQGVF